MHIVILGSGQVAHSLVDYLVDEGYEITVVDQNELAVKSLQVHFDIKGVVGHPCDPMVLKKADMEHADFMIGATLSDEINMLACLVSHQAFQTPIRMACVRNSNYLNHPDLDIHQNLSIDIAFNPEEEVTNYIHRLILNPGIIETATFDDDKIVIILIKVDQKMSIFGHQVKDLNHVISNVYFIFAGLHRRDAGALFSLKTYIENEDEIYFLVRKEDIQDFLLSLKHQASMSNTKNIAIVGGGEIGSRLAKKLEKKFDIKLIEKDPVQAEFNAKILDEAMVLIGDATDAELLSEENIQDADIFVAVTDSDEVNLLSSQFAKKLGVSQVISLLKRKDYVDLAEKNQDIDVIISPDHATLNRILTHVHRDNIMVCYALHHHDLQIIEFLVQSDSKVANQRIKDIVLPEGVHMIAVVRNTNLFQARDDFRIKQNDHVIIVVNNTLNAKRLEKIFKTSS